jgi:hypothetical protein
MKIRLIIFLFISLFTTVSFASYCSPSATSCEYYKCLEKEKNCGKNGFLIKTGYNFCKNFLSLDRKLNDQGKQWLTNTRLCLQRSLENVNYLSCNEFANKSVDQHVDCFIRHNYCSLSLRNKFKIYRVLLKELFIAPRYLARNVFSMIRRGCF